MAGLLDIFDHCTGYAQQDMSYSFSENAWGEKYIEDINRADFATTPSKDLFDQILDFQLQDENCLFIVSGSDSGLLLPWLRQQKVGRGSRLVVVELDDVYQLVAIAYRGVLGNNIAEDAKVSRHPISLHRLSSWQHEVFDGSDEAWVNGGSIRLLESNASAADYSRRYTSMQRAIAKAAEERMTAMSSGLNREIFSKMQFRNAIDSVEPLRSNPEFGVGKTAIVLGGGPSLDRHIDWVKKNRSKLFVLAVSRIANKLLKEKLNPDMVVSVDPHDASYEVSKQGVLWTDVPLVYNFHVSFKLLQQWQGPTFYLGRRLPWHNDNQLVDFVPASGPTVSHAAVNIAYHLGFAQVLLTGVDLCYSVSASTHADDSPEQIIEKMPSLCNAQVTTYSGRNAGTNIAFKNSVDALDKLGNSMQAKGIKLFNLSKDAAICVSIPHLANTEVILPESKPELSDYINLEVRSITLQELVKLEREFKLAKHVFNKIRVLCGKAKSLVEQVHGNSPGVNTAKVSSRLARVRKQIESEYPEYIRAVTYHYGLEFSKTKLPTDFDEMSAGELVDWGKHYYNLIERSICSLIEEIDSQAFKLQLRRDEQNPDISVRELGRRWREDETPGRILRWKSLNGVNVKPEDRAWVQRYIGKFRASLNIPPAKTVAAFCSENPDISYMLKSLVFLAQNQSISELQAIERRFDVNIWPYSALKSYTAGLAHVLQNDQTSAICDFQNAIDFCTTRMDSHPDSIDSMKRLIEECLVRMNSCYINTDDYASSLTTLGMLSEISSSYVVSYAKMLHISGQNENAINLLKSYVNLYPSDRKAQFVLNKWLPEVNSAAISDQAHQNPVYKNKIDDAIQAVMGK